MIVLVKMLKLNMICLIMKQMLMQTSYLAKKLDWTSLKAELYKIDAEKLNTDPVDLSKLGNVVNNDVVKKNMYDKLVAKVNNIDTGAFVLKSIHDTNGLNLEKKSMTQTKKCQILAKIL